MRPTVRIAWALALGLSLLPHDVFAQRYYPRGYGSYGWGGWGMGATDPAAGYMAGLGAYARGQGVYELLNAQAQAINITTMQKWNQELRARQQQLQQEKQAAQAAVDAQRDARIARMELEDGTTLNRLLMQILNFDPSAIRSSQARAPIGSSAVREIPFQWNTEALTICIDQLTARDALPEALTDPAFATERSVLGKAVDAALKEDAQGDVSAATTKRLNTAIANFRARFVKVVSKSDPGYEDGDDYFTTLASLSRMLHDPSMKRALGELETLREISVGDLVAFMHTYNLRFGPATTAEQVQIYQTLARLLNGVLNDVNAAPVPPPPPPGRADKGGKGLQKAAQDAFKNMGWQQLDAQAR